MPVAAILLSYWLASKVLYGLTPGKRKPFWTVLLGLTVPVKLESFPLRSLPISGSVVAPFALGEVGLLGSYASLV